MKTVKIDNTMNDLPKAVDFVRNELLRRKVSKKESARIVLMTEEVIRKMIETATDGITIKVYGFFDLTRIWLSAKGTEFSASDIKNNLLFDEEDTENTELNALIHRLVEKVIGGTLTVWHEYGVNKVSIRVKGSSFKTLLTTLGALFAGVGAGLLMQKVLSPSMATAVSNNVFSPVYTMFMNALKMIVGPLVFCSIASAIADFSDLKALGRMAIKIVVFYLFTSLIAIGVGYLTYQLFPIGNPSLAASVSDAAASTIATGQSVKISIKDTIVGIIPNNIITPFQKSDMLQLIFMAVIVGLASASLSEKFPALRKGLVLLNNLFSKITTVLVSFIPIIVFCAMAKMMLSMHIEKLLNVVVWIPTIYAGGILMFCVYILLIVLFARLNPFKFFGNFFPAMISAFTLASSNAALPASIKSCHEMGVSKRIYSFSLPLGATINMNGSCVSLMITALFMAKIFGLPVTGSALTTIIVSIMVLSVGAPGVPGGALVCMTILLPQIGVPAESVSLVMGLYPIMAMMQTCVNVTGDAVVTAIVAKQEKMLDVKQYNA
ncbi:MAG: dicarboxylate/amino acid:cation symporter [Treponema sp.]|nr:dicarboxylate/amino acid:cation symporter [Treponema sp.]